MQINRQSYEEYFLLYADGELNESEKKAVEEFIDQNPDLAGELSLIQETVFKPDGSIVFDKKELLFKDESDERKVIYMRWFRVAAAAAILITATVVGWVFLGDKNLHKQPVEIVKTPETKKADPSEIVTAEEVKQESVQQESNQQKAKSRSSITLAARSEKNNSYNGNEHTRTTENIQAQHKEIVNDPGVVDVVPPVKPVEGTAFTQDVVSTEAVKETIDVPVEPRAIENKEDEHHSDVSYAQSFPQEQDDDIIYFANTSLTKKTKLRGVLRKATRYLDRVTSLQ